MRGRRRVEVVGDATDHRVRVTPLDAVREGFDTTVSPDMTARVAQATVNDAQSSMRAAGMTLTGQSTVRT
jgi:nicotinamidase/pyrazinamidase